MKTWLIIANGTSWQMFLICLLIFSQLGILVNLWLGSTERNVESASTPVAFSWKFLITDNWKRILTAELVTIIILLFYPLAGGFLNELVISTEVPYNFPAALNPFSAMLIGGMTDRIAQTIKVKFAAFQQKRSISPITP